MKSQHSKFDRDRIIEVEPEFYKSPFSVDEEDYGVKKNNNMMVTREGIITFNGNSALKERPTALSSMAKHYKATMKHLITNNDRSK